MFMEEAFLNFIEWLKGEGEQAELAKSIKYVLVAGDLVDGCGVYKGQINELTLPDIEDQYNYFARLISQIPKHITTIICPGNHDATREAEPQPAIPTTFAPELYKIPNVIMVSSPCLVRLGGLLALMYHGTSLDSIIAAVPSLRKTGYDHPETAMLTLLQKRHLCPVYDEARIFSETEDQLVINRVPNILHMGHVHSIGAAIHRGVRVINSGAFQSQTPFQAKIGHHPTPGIVPIIDGNGKITLINFTNKETTSTQPNMTAAE
jgi:DNA polymerase II small subunit